MNRALKWTGIGIGVAIAGVAAMATYFAASWGETFPDVPKPAIVASDEAEVIERGRYLFHAVGHCTSCHAPRQEVLAMKPDEELVPSGGELPMGPLGTLRPPNLTSHPTAGMGQHSDGELARAIRYAVKADDTVALMMIAAGPMSDEDLTAIVSYMRTLAPSDAHVAPSEVSLLGKVLLQTAMRFAAHPKPEFEVPPYVAPGEVSVARGKYLAEGPGACFGCHSEFDGSEFEFVGELFCGNPTPWPDITDPDHEIFAPNLTTHPRAGRLAGLSEEDFVTRMRAPRMYAGSPMAWENFARMTEEDLRSIFRYLTSRAPCDRDVGPVYAPA